MSVELNDISIAGNVSRLNVCKYKCGSEINVDKINPPGLSLNLWQRAMLVMIK